MADNSGTAEAWRDTETFDEHSEAPLAPAAQQEGVALRSVNSGVAKKEWASTLLLVEEACESIKAAEERVEALERELELANAKAREEQRQLMARLHSMQEENQVVQAKSKAWEARAMEAESWLNRLNDAIVTNFSSVTRRDEGKSN